MVKRRHRSRHNTNTSVSSSRVECVKDALVMSGLGRGPLDHGASRASSCNTDSPLADFHCGSIPSEQLYPHLIRQLVISRLVLFSVQCLGGCLPDAKTDAFKGVQADDFKSNLLLQTMFGGFVRWDAHHFLHIAEFGYTWESTLAFFPLYPFLLRFVGSIVQLLFWNVSLYTCMVVSGVLLNNVLFVINGLLLYQLCLNLTRSEKESILAVYVYCFNPSSIFFSAVYTESTYLTFTLLGLLIIYPDYDTKCITQRALGASCCFALGYMTRANGWLNLGYVGYLLLMAALTRRNDHGQLVWERARNIGKALKMVVLFALCAFVVLVPMNAVGWLLQDRFCHSTTAFYSKQDQQLRQSPFHDESAADRVLPGDLPRLKWCARPNALPLLPPYYTGVQQKYWQVGVLHYWQWRKLPLFLMAAPTFLLLLYGLMDSILDMPVDKRSGAEMLADTAYMIPFALHNLFLGITALLLYNVEVVTRILFSSTPFMYIAVARLMASHCPRIQCPGDLCEPPVLPFFVNYFFVNRTSKWLLVYLFGYCFVGTVAFVNWLPYV